MKKANGNNSFISISGLMTPIVVLDPYDTCRDADIHHQHSLEVNPDK
ncbi:MAG: hypothetical protein ABI844_01275 [Saprospiraceae bacterium]